MIRVLAGEGQRLLWRSALRIAQICSRIPVTPVVFVFLI